MPYFSHPFCGLYRKCLKIIDCIGGRDSHDVEVCLCSCVVLTCMNIVCFTE